MQDAFTMPSKVRTVRTYKRHQIDKAYRLRCVSKDIGNSINRTRTPEKVFYFIYGIGLFYVIY